MMMMMVIYNSYPYSTNNDNDSVMIICYGDSDFAYIVKIIAHCIDQTREGSEPAMPTDLQFLHGTLDDAAINSAKQLGRQLFSQLEVSERKARLDHMVCVTLRPLQPFTL